MDKDEWYVMPRSPWNDARVHHPAEDATPEDLGALCAGTADDADLRVATPADRERYDLCRVCRAIASDEPDPRGNHGQSNRTPADVLRDCGFDTEADDLERGRS